jgi:hypothetical protein
MDAPIFYGDVSDDDGGVPDLGGNSPIEFRVNGSTGTTSVDGRDLGTVNIPVVVTGIDASYTVGVADLPDGATWSGGAIVWSPAASGTYSPIIEVRDAEDHLVASQQLELVIHLPLTASVPQTSYEVEVGEPLVITPSVANLITDGAVQWGGTLPGWLDLNEADGKVTVDTSTVRSADNLILTAVDQTDLKHASTQPFSVAVNGVCGAWTARAYGASNSWASVVYGNGKFVAVSNSGAGDRIMTSPDGSEWTSVAAPEQNGWLSVAYGNGRFVAVAYSGTNRIMTSLDGVNWVPVAAPEQNSWYSVTYGNGKFVAIAGDGVNQVMNSPDGVTWTAHPAIAGSWGSVTYGDGQFVAVANGGTDSRVMTSPDGINWMNRSPAALNDWRSVTYGNGKFVAVSSNGVNRVMTSPDGVIWTARSTGLISYWNSVTYGSGQFVAISPLDANRVMTSPDGINWTAETAAEQLSWQSAAYGNGRFVAVANSGTSRIMISDCN